MEQGGKENGEYQHDGDDEEDERDADGQMRKDAEESAQDDGRSGLRGRRGDEAVSYTHLDVYKRQEENGEAD